MISKLVLQYNQIIEEGVYNINESKMAFRRSCHAGRSIQAS